MPTPMYIVPVSANPYCLFKGGCRQPHVSSDTHGVTSRFVSPDSEDWGSFTERAERMQRNMLFISVLLPTATPTIHSAVGVAIVQWQRTSSLAGFPPANLAQRPFRQIEPQSLHSGGQPGTLLYTCATRIPSWVSSPEKWTPLPIFYTSYVCSYSKTAHIQVHSISLCAALQACTSASFFIE